MAMTPRCRSWRRARPSPGTFGPMCATTAPSAGPRRRRPFITLRGTANRSIPSAICKASPAFCRPTLTAAIIRCYDPSRAQGVITSALCWAHARRQFFELADIAANARRGRQAPPISPIALEAVKRIDALFDIERCINGLSADERLRVSPGAKCAARADLEAWLREERASLSRSASVAKPIDYMLKRWDRFRALPRRWPDLPDEQCRRAGASRICTWKEVVAVRRFRTRRRSRRRHVRR